MRFKRYLLTEKTFAIKSDVELLYNKAYKNFFDIFKKYNYDLTNEKLKEEIENRMDKVYYTNSSILQSKDAKEAHLVNPIDIFLGVFNKGSFYRPSETAKAVFNKNKGFIQVSLNKQALKLIIDNRIDVVTKNQMTRFKNEFLPDRAKTSISHELSHWINDSLHNFNISNLLKTAREADKKDMVLLGKKDINMTPFEMDANIHAIKQLKMSNRKQWDNMTLIDLFNKYQPLASIGYSTVKYGDDVFYIWQKLLTKRMARENLLGKNMKKFVTPKEIRNLAF